MINLLDCTLRDGGYNTGWRFPDGFVRRHLELMNAAGVSVVEVGYRRPAGETPYQRCEDANVARLASGLKAPLCVMIDLKNYIVAKKNGRTCAKLMEQNFGPRAESPFAYVRVAITTGEADYVPGVVRILHERGYKVILNVMRASTVTLASKELLAALGCADVTYWADSFGALEPKDIAAFPSMGLHTHDNMGLAFINSCAAIASGKTWLDASVAGFGRGAGNLKLEQIAAWLVVRGLNKKLDLDAIDRASENLWRCLEKAKSYDTWGWTPGYMLSGLLNMHPNYPRNAEAKGMDCLEVRKYLLDVPQAKRTVYEGGVA